MSGPRMWVCLATLTGTGLAAAQPLAWNNPAGGDWSVPANWSPQQTPTTLSNVQLGLSGPFTVRLGTFSASCATLAIPNPVATLDIRMNETLRVTATAASLPIEGTVLVGDGQFGNPSVLDMTSPGTAAFTGAGRLVLNARRELVLPFAVVRAPGRQISLGSAFRVEGRGAIQGTVTCAGTLAPGLGPGAAGEFAIDSLAMTPSGVLEFDIAGPSFFDYDRIQVAFSGQRGGTLRVRLSNGFTPGVGATFQLITGSFFGSFAAVDAPGFVLLTGPSVAVQYVGFPCDPDVNQDGNADQDDVAALTNVVAGGPCP